LVRRIKPILFCISCLSVMLAVTVAQARQTSNMPYHGQQGHEYSDVDQFRSPSPETLVADWIFDAEAPILSSPTICDVNGDSIAEIVVTTYGKGPNPYASGYVIVLDIGGDTVAGWPVQTAAPFAASCAIGDVDGDSLPELITGDWSNAYAWSGDRSPLPGWPKWPGTYVTPALGDLDGDGELEIIYSGTDNRLYVWHEDGSLMAGWPFTAPDLIGPPAVADIDNDDTLEIVAATFEGPVGPDSFQVYAWEANGSVIAGFPVWTSGVNKPAPAVGDMDLDGTLEIAIVSYHTSNLDFIYVFDPSGNLEPGWPVRAEYVRLSSPALGDIDGDGDLEILVGGYDTGVTREKAFAYHHNGIQVSGWPVVLDHPGASGNINSSMIIADIDGIHSGYDTYWPLYKHDPAGTSAFPEGGITHNGPEVLVKVVDHIFALNPDGNPVGGFPYFLDDESHMGTHSPSPAVADMDLDGDAELVCASSSGLLAFLDMEPTGLSERSVRRDRADDLGLTVMPNPLVAYTEIRASRSMSLEICDSAGRLVRRFSGNQARWYGKDGSGARVPDGVYFAVARDGKALDAAKIVVVR
jgi:hypothetical protein